MEKKITELTKKLDKRTLVIWATDCAEHVLSYFEEKYPKDKRPREAIEAGRAWIREEITVGEARTAAFAAHAAARDVDEGVTQAVARAAGHAAATVHVAGHAIHAAIYAATFIDNERIWQYQHLIELAKEK
ncbi:MAG: putative immunity protein [Candidatus Heimdallarchaeota archaeon]